MAIINPASENQIYECSESSWYFDSEYIVSFGEGNTSYQKETIEGKPFKIVWDNQEHIINNPNNYSYSIEGINYAIINYYWTSGARWLSSKLPLWEDELGSCYIVTASGRKNVYTSRGLYRLLTNYSETVTNESFTYNSGNATVWERLVGAKPPSVQTLRIIDDNIIYSYSIIDPQSVKVLFSQDQIKYIFSGNNTNVETIKNTEKNVVLKCGLDCPPESCLKCRDGDYVCCYSNDGIAIDRVYDPNGEISDTC